MNTRTLSPSFTTNWSHDHVASTHEVPRLSHVHYAKMTRTMDAVTHSHSLELRMVCPCSIVNRDFDKKDWGKFERFVWQSKIKGKKKNTLASLLICWNRTKHDPATHTFTRCYAKPV